MGKLSRYLLIEWKLLFRNISFWLLLIIIIGLFYLTTLNQYRINDLGWYVTSMLYLYLPPLFLIAQFLSVAAARRDITTKTYAIHHALPFQSLQVISARLLALIIPFSMFALIPAAFYLIRGMMLGIEITTLSSGIGVLCTYIIPMVFTIVLSYWIGTWTRKRIIYLISFAIILFFIIFARLLFSQFVSAQWVHLVDMGMTDLYSWKLYSELWGFTIDRTFWLHRGLYIGVSFILLGIIVGSLMQRRREKKGRIGVVSVIGTAVLVCVFTFVSYASIWQERSLALEQQINFYQHELVRENPLFMQQKVIAQFIADDLTEDKVLFINEMTFENYEEAQAVVQGNQLMGNSLSEEHKRDLLLGQHYATLKALAYDLEVTTGSNHMLEVQANIQLTHDLDQPFERFPLSLRHIFAVDSVRINDVKVDFEWENFKDVLWIEASDLPPGEVFTLNLNYSGQINEWYLRKSSGAKDDYWERRVFIDDDKLFLPSFYGWYPIPGNKRLAEYEAVYFGNHNSQLSRLSHEIRENMIPHHPADFRIVVNTPSQMTITSNGTQLDYEVLGSTQRVEFAAVNSDGLSLVGGDMTRRSASNDHGALSLILSNQITNNKAEQMTNELLAYYEELTGIIKTIDSNFIFWPQVTFIRADYPGSFDHSLVGTNKAYSPTDDLSSNSTQYLTYRINLSNFKPFSQTSFNEHILNQSLFSSGDAVGNGRYYEFIGIITNYIERTVYPTEGPLFDPMAHRVSGEPSQLYLAVNSLYERTGHDRFLDVIPDIYYYVTDYYKDGYDYDAIVGFRADFTDYVNSLAGDAP